MTQSYRLQKAFEAPPAKSASGTPRPAQTGKSSESVEISSSSQSVQKVSDTIKALPEVRIELVDKIRERIKNNDYPIAVRFDNALEKMHGAGIL